MVRKTVITGTGRAGTTFLVQLLTDLGLDTGYSQEQLDVDPVSHAGLEQPNWETEEAPYIVKSPLIAESIHYALAEGGVAIDHVFIPMRPLKDVVASRERVTRLLGDAAPGGLDGGCDAARQLNRHARQFFGLMVALARYDIPHTLLEFPRLVVDCEYTHRKLAPLLDTVTYERFSDSFGRLARPDLVHFDT